MRLQTLAVVACALFVSAAACPVLAGDCLVCPTPAEDSLFTLINQFRTGQGLPAFEIDARLIVSARRQAGDMMRNDFLGFEGTDGSSPPQRQLDALYSQPGEENLVVQSEGAQATFDLLAGAGSVTGHWLDTSFHHIGIAYFANPLGEVTSAWALDYGRESGEPAETVCRVIYCPDEVESQLLDLINQTRLDSGRVALELDARLVVSAQSQACDMGRYYFVDEISADGLPAVERIANAGYLSPGPTLVASGLITLQQVVNGWLTDPADRLRLLDPTATHVGVGFGGNGMGPIPWTWAVDFGTATTPAEPPDCGCCMGMRGNVNADPGEVVNLSDLTVLANHLFVTFEPVYCEDEANVSGDSEGELSLTDLTILVNHLFVTFQPLLPCP